MKFPKRRYMFLILLVLWTVCMPVTALANSPPPSADGSAEQMNPLWIFIYLFINVGGIVFSCTVEWLVAVAFTLAKDYEKKILLTNLATQIIMRGAYYGLSLLMPEGIPILVWYAVCVAVLEVLAYVSEYLIYRRIMKDVCRKYCLIYTIAANTASLVGGLIVLMIIF